jgi:hypothetical protein
VWIIALGVCALGASAVSGSSWTRAIAEAVAGLVWIIAIDRGVYYQIRDAGRERRVASPFAVGEVRVISP